MIRGRQTITAIFKDEQPNPKRVNGAFMPDRDAAIAYRFYYHYKLLRRTFEDAVDGMQNEFFISSSTIVTRLTQNDALLRDITNNKPTRNDLRKRYPHFNWN